MIEKMAEASLVLVTGATGFTGKVLLRKLAEGGMKVRAIVRESSDLTPLSDLQVDWYRGDVFDQDVVGRASEGVEYIFHIAAAFREAKLRDSDYWNVHVQSTRLLAKSALESPVFKRLIHVSTVGVHSHIENPPADEEYPIRPGDIYQETKAEAELWLRKFAAEHELPYTVLRPAAIYGPADKRLLKVFRMATWRYFPILGSGKCLYHLIHVEDLTDIMIRAAVHPDALGEVFICGNPEPIILEEMGRIVADELGLNFKVLRLPAWPFFVAGHICQFVCRPLGIEPPIYPRRVAFFTKDRSFDTTKLQERLGYQVRYKNEEGIRETARAYVAKGWLDRC